jgi:hypothetical protein
MVTMVLRRLFWLALLAGAGFAGWALWTSSRQGPPRAVAAGTPARAPVSAAPAAPAAPWVAPVEGACPDGYPIKANDNSGIYHVPGGRFYERTRPERCYPTATAAEADGYRRSKS